MVWQLTVDGRRFQCQHSSNYSSHWLSHCLQVIASPKIHDLIDKNSTLFIIYSNKYKECKIICLTVSLSILMRVSHCASVVDCHWLCVGRHLSCISYRLSCIGVVCWCHVFHHLSLVISCWPSAVAGCHRIIPYCRWSSLVGRRPSLLSAIVGARPSPILAGVVGAIPSIGPPGKKKKVGVRCSPFWKLTVPNSNIMCCAMPYK